MSIMCGLCRANVYFIWASCAVYTAYMYALCAVYITYMYASCELYMWFMCASCALHVQLIHSRGKYFDTFSPPPPHSPPPLHSPLHSESSSSSLSSSLSTTSIPASRFLFFSSCLAMTRWVCMNNNTCIVKSKLLTVIRLRTVWKPPIHALSCSQA